MRQEEPLSIQSPFNWDWETAIADVKDKCDSFRSPFRVGQGLYQQLYVKDPVRRVRIQTGEAGMKIFNEAFKSIWPDLKKD